MKKKKKPIQVVYNNKPDPVVKVTEYTYTGEGLKMGTTDTGRSEKFSGNCWKLLAKIIQNLGEFP